MSERKQQCWATAGYKDHGRWGAIFAQRCRLEEGHPPVPGMGHDFPTEGERNGEQ